MQTATPWLDQLAIIWDLPAGFLLCLALGSACAWILHLVIEVRALRSETALVTRRALGLTYLTYEGQHNMHCDNCGTRVDRGLCPNCHEEAFIVETQGDYLPDHLSDEFLRSVGEQRVDARRRFSVVVPSKSGGA